MKAELEKLVPGGSVEVSPIAIGQVLGDATEAQGISGSAEALVLASSSEEVAAVVAWCYANDVPLTTRGGGTGFAGAAVPDGGIVLSLDPMNRVLAIEPGQWRMHAEAGCTTAQIHRIAREHGLLFPPDPGAAENSTLGGNIATNAGGPHAYRYGVTGNWVTGLELVIPPGEIIRVGGPLRKDVSGYDLMRLMIGSEGTLAVITAAWLKLVPAPEAQAVLMAFYTDTESGCEALAAVAAAGIQATALEFLDRGSLAASLGSFPFAAPADPGFAVIVEVDGHPEETRRLGGEVAEILGQDARGEVLELTARGEVAELWRWRDGVSIAVTAQRGGKMSEDIVVPVEKLAAAVEGTHEIGRRYQLAACAWGHGGDGNLHSTFMIDRNDPEEIARAQGACDDLFAWALELGGSISGEHGIGTVKAPWVERALGARVSALQTEIKRLFDPKNLLNPGKKLAPPRPN